MLASSAIGGVALGLIVGRDWRRLANIRLRWLPILIGALLLRSIAVGVEMGLVYASAVLITAIVAAANWRLPGAVLIAVGSAMNLVVILANTGMPVDASALAQVGTAVPLDGLHTAIGPTTLLSPLADVVVIAPFGAAYSLGDILIAAGAFLLPFITLARE